MTTAREVKLLVAPLLAQHPEMALVGRALVLKPVHHLLHQVFIDRTGSANVCQPSWGISGLWSKRETWDLGYGERLQGPGLWDLNQQDLSEILAEEVEKVALPKFRAVGSIRDFLTFLLPTEKEQNWWPTSYASCLLALGELDKARDVLASGEYASGWWFPHLDQLGIKERLLKLGNRLGAADRATIAGLLHEWEAYSVKKLKIEHLWEKTPFPLEQA